MTSTEDEELSNQEKWRIAVLLGIIFLIMISPLIFNITNSITSRYFFSVCDERGRPNVYGIIVHTLIFVIIVRVLMKF